MNDALPPENSGRAFYLYIRSAVGKDQFIARKLRILLPEFAAAEPQRMRFPHLNVYGDSAARKPGQRVLKPACLAFRQMQIDSYR